jgi:hypothetical protein
MKNRIFSLSFLLLFAFVVSVSAAKVDTLLVKSPSMNKDVKVVVIAPDGTKAQRMQLIRFFIFCMATVVMPKAGLN